MIRVTALVEGFGDVQAVPVLLGRMGNQYGEVVIADRPIRVGGWRSLLATGDLPRFLELAASRGSDMILIALDLEDDCAVEERSKIQGIVNEWKNGREITVETAFFVREYETLFIQASEGLPNARAISGNVDPESIRDAKGALRNLIGRRYRETQDQENFSRNVNLASLYEKPRSYRRLCRAVLGREYTELASHLVN